MLKKLTLMMLFMLSLTTPSLAALEKTAKDDPYLLLELFGAAFQTARSEYVDETSDRKLIEAAINGMLSSLDPHSSFLDDDTYRDMQIQTKGEFGGLGMEVTMENGMLRIISPLDDTPAFKAKLQPGDIITHIDDDAIVGLTLNEAVEKMRGKPKTKVKLTIRRKNQEPFDVTLTRDIIKIETVKYEVKNEDIVKGFEYEDGKYVIFDDKDFEKLKTKKDKNINIECFVNLDEIDPLYFDRPFYVNPTGAEKAFKILLKAMEDENKAAIAKTVLGTKESLIAIRAKDGQMLLNTLFFQDEVQENPAEDLDLSVPSSAAELKMAKTIISEMTEKFQPEKYHDEYRERLLKAIDQKISGKQIVRPKEKAPVKIANLLDALKLSLENVETNKKEKSKKINLSKGKKIKNKK